MNAHLADKGITLRSGTLVDATIIDEEQGKGARPRDVIHQEGQRLSLPKIDQTAELAAIARQNRAPDAPLAGNSHSNCQLGAAERVGQTFLDVASWVILAARLFFFAKFGRLCETTSHTML